MARRFDLFGRKPDMRINQPTGNLGLTRVFTKGSLPGVACGS
jgi:hypothetical protein